MHRRVDSGPPARPSVPPGLNVGRGKDDTLFAKVTGHVKFTDHGAHGRKISIMPVDAKS